MIDNFSTHIHSTIALSDIVKDIKNGSSEWIKNEKIFPEFTFRQVRLGADLRIQLKKRTRWSISLKIKMNTIGLNRFVKNTSNY
jgi:hypothetical protein